MRKFIVPFAVFTGIVLFIGCRKKNECDHSPGYSLTPSIQLTSVLFTVDTTVYYGNLDTFVISFTDGGKDLVNKPGDDSEACIAPSYKYPPQTYWDSCLLNDPTRNLFLVDTRDSNMVGYQINSTDTVSLAATGVTTCGYDGQITFPVQIFDFKCTSGYGPQCLDTVVYKIFVRDNSGHFSNIIQTPPIIIIPTQ